MTRAALIAALALGALAACEETRPPTTPGPTPLVFEGLASAYDELRGEWVVFSTAENIGDRLEAATWIWRDGRWILADVGGPPTRRFAAMAWDPGRGAVVMMGGNLVSASRGEDGLVAVTTDERLRDVWTWDGARWTAVDAGAGPPAVSRHRLVWVPPRQALMLVGGVVDACPTPESCSGQWWLDTQGWRREP